MSILLATAMLIAFDNPLFREPVDKVELDRDEVRRLGVHFGDCVVKREPDLARAYVLEVDRAPQVQQQVYTVADAIKQIENGGKSADETVKKLSIGDCLLRPSDTAREVGMRFTGDTMRYVLADAIFKREFAYRPPLSGLEQVPELAQSAFLNKFGECIVRYDPRGAHALLLTPVLKPEENAAFGALKPAMGACLAANSTVKLNKMMIRGAVAYNYVLLANAARTAATGSAAK